MNRKKLLFFAVCMFACCSFSHETWASFTIEKFRLSMTSIRGAGHHVTMYYKVCIKTGSKQVTVTSYYGDDETRVGLTQLKTTTHQVTHSSGCVETAHVVLLGNYVLHGARRIHMKVEQTGGSITWRKTLLNISEKPDIGFQGTMTANKSTLSFDDSFELRFSLKNNGLSRLGKGVKIQFYVHEDQTKVLDPSQATMFTNQVDVDDVEANSLWPTTGSKSVTLRFPSLASRQRKLYVAAIIDEAKALDENNRQNNTKIILLSFEAPDVGITSVVVAPNPFKGLPNTLFSWTVKLKNFGLVDTGAMTLDCIVIWKSSTLEVSRVLGHKVKSLKPNETTTEQLVASSPSRDLYPDSYDFRCTVELDSKKAEYNDHANRHDGKIKVDGWYDLYIRSLFTLKQKEVTGKEIEVEFLFGVDGALSPPSFTGKLLFLPKNQSVTYTLASKLSFPAFQSNQRVIKKKLLLLRSIPPGKGKLRFELTAPVGDEKSTNHEKEYDFEIIADDDEDGFGADKDCNDKDKNIHPKAKEVCNGKDDNCNGKIDENDVCGVAEKNTDEHEDTNEARCSERIENHCSEKTLEQETDENKKDAGTIDEGVQIEEQYRVQVADAAEKKHELSSKEPLQEKDMRTNSGTKEQKPETNEGDSQKQEIPTIEEMGCASAGCSFSKSTSSSILLMFLFLLMCLPRKNN